MVTPRSTARQGSLPSNTAKVYGLVMDDDDDRRAQLPRSQRKAILLAFDELLKEHNSTIAVGKLIRLPQQTVWKAIHTKRPGPKVALALITYLHTTLDKLVEKYGTAGEDRPKREDSVNLSVSEEVKRVGSAYSWLPRTLNQLELHWRTTGKLADDEELKMVGEQFDRINRLADRRRELQNDERTLANSEIFTTGKK